MRSNLCTILLTCNAYAVPKQQFFFINLSLFKVILLNCYLVSDDDILNNSIIVGSNGKNSEDCIRLNK